MKSVLVDTSFLISYTTPTRPHHQAAVSYFKTFIAKSVRMYLSTIVVSEFEVRQRVNDLGLQNFIVLPFNIEHGIAAGSLVDSAFASPVDGYQRAALKDDVKLMAQCELAGIEHFISDDSKCVDRMKGLRQRKAPRALPIGIKLEDGFQAAWFNDGQEVLVEH